MDEKHVKPPVPVDISEEDVIEAMKRMRGYFDITPGDFKEIYKAAYEQAVERLLTTLKARDLMSAPVQVLAVEMELVMAASILAQRGISGAPVVDGGGQIVGVVSEKDFLREMGFGVAPSFMQIATHCMHDKGCMIGKLHNRRVRDIMSAPPITARAEVTIGEISSIFSSRGINRLPIVSPDDRPIGIVTRTDLAHSYTFLAGGGR